MLGLTTAPDCPCEWWDAAMGISVIFGLTLVHVQCTLVLTRVSLEFPVLTMNPEPIAPKVVELNRGRPLNEDPHLRCD